MLKAVTLNILYLGPLKTRVLTFALMECMIFSETHHQTRPVHDVVEILDSEYEELQIALIVSIESSEAIVDLPDIQ